MDDSIENNDIEPQAMRYLHLHHIHNSTPPKQCLAENESNTQNKSRCSNDNVSMKGPIKSDIEARDNEDVKPAAKK